MDLRRCVLSCTLDGEIPHYAFNIVFVQRSWVQQHRQNSPNKLCETWKLITNIVFIPWEDLEQCTVNQHSPAGSNPCIENTCILRTSTIPQASILSISIHLWTELFSYRGDNVCLSITPQDVMGCSVLLQVYVSPKAGGLYKIEFSPCKRSSSPVQGWGAIALTGLALLQRKWSIWRKLNNCSYIIFQFHSL